MNVIIHDYKEDGFSIYIRNSNGTSLHIFNKEEGPIGLVDVIKDLGVSDVIYCENKQGE